MKDFLGQELNVGDKVVTVRVGCRDLRKGIVGKINPIKIRVDFIRRDGIVDTFMTNPDFVVKYNTMVVPANPV